MKDTTVTYIDSFILVPWSLLLLPAIAWAAEGALIAKNEIYNDTYTLFSLAIGLFVMILSWLGGGTTVLLDNPGSRSRSTTLLLMVHDS